MNKSPIRDAFYKAGKGFELLTTAVVDLFDEVAGTKKPFSLRDYEIDPLADRFAVHALGNTTRLKIPLGDVDPSELSVRHDGTRVLFSVEAFSKGFLIENLRLYLQGIRPELREEQAQELAHLRWSSCSANDLNVWVKAWLGSSNEGAEEGDLWSSRAMTMAKPLHAALVELRDKGELELNITSYRKFLTLDGYVALSHNQILSEHAREMLRTWLMSLPGFNEDDALNGSMSRYAHEHYGYLSMQLTCLLTESANMGKARSYRMGNADIEYASAKVIRDITAVLSDGVLTIELVHAEPGFRAVPIQLQEIKN
ncbi:hypothetical protein DV532_27055 (plasmid) [Pseudomonas sp. Leaf58]|uniref:hypothetical protein n=1 Tax=Pseudomonas sp. Leaf58 TaxID=1736226 RepID=UPI0006FD1632|nr:hypothetical protein [Pseudomonas sp. Leaf58]AYG47942.1 hypothetical protein DV532_27055 [Pseudomonas sp. Leaf58]KQN62495.1 hypothetical protein ASF02_10115 [Pseudomonas sp. Leaf58]